VKILGSVGQPVWKTAASGPHGGKQTLGYVQTKNCFGWEILNSVLLVCTPAYRAPVLLFSSDASFEPVWGIRKRGGARCFLLLLSWYVLLH
jgi:hypothetical protein